MAPVEVVALAPAIALPGWGHAVARVAPISTSGRQPRPPHGRSHLTDETIQQATSTELTGGAGFTYEDTIVAYYLGALLREERAAPLNGIVKTVAVQQEGHGHPMDDIIVEFDETLSLIHI